MLLPEVLYENNRFLHNQQIECPLDERTIKIKENAEKVNSKFDLTERNCGGN